MSTMKRRVIYVDDQMWAAVITAAERQGVSVSQMMRASVAGILRGPDVGPLAASPEPRTQAEAQRVFDGAKAAITSGALDSHVALIVSAPAERPFTPAPKPVAKAKAPRQPLRPATPRGRS